jgi:hypothetical protein
VANATVRQLLSPTVTSKAISRIAAAEMPMLAEFGFQPGGPSELPIGHRTHGYDVFNNTRTVGMTTVPGEAAKTVTRQSVGRVNVTVQRMHEMLPMSAEELHNLRPIGGNSNVFDNLGESYIRRQLRFMGQRAANFRAALLGGMMRGTAYVHPNGNDLYMDYTSGTNAYTLSWQMPSGNLNQLNMLGAGNIITGRFDAASTDIPSVFEQIDIALQNLVGLGLQIVVCGAQMWTYITNNDAVAMKAGIANTPFTEYTRRPAGTIDAPQNLKIGRLACLPWLEFIITDTVLELGAQGSTTKTKLVPDNTFWFGPRPLNDQLFQMAIGSEPIAEGPNMAPVVKMGMSSWTTWQWNPTATLLFTLDNAIPVNYVPAASGLATAIF